MPLLLKSFLLSCLLGATPALTVTNSPVQETCQEIIVEKHYGGSASVRVKDDDGNTRVINVTTSCLHDTVSAAKSRLRSSIESERRYYEKLVSSISYSIDSCE